MKRISLKLKITLWYTLFMLGLSAILLGATYAFGQQLVDRDIQNRLIGTVGRTAARALSADPFSGGAKGTERKAGIRSEGDAFFPGPPDGEAPPELPNGATPPPFREREGEFFPDFRLYNQGIHLMIYREDGTLLEGQVPFDLEKLPAFSEDAGVQTITEDSQRYYCCDKKVTSGDTVLWVRGMAAGSDSAGMLSSIMKLALPLVLLLILLASAGGYIILSRAFVPVNKIREAAEEISESGDLSQRIAIGEAKDEISSLADTFDRMLTRLEDSFEREKQFTSDASHELRTPIAVIRSECEYMDTCAETIEEYRESAASISRQADKMAKLVSELLTISRMDQNTLAVNFETVDISELVTFVCEEQTEIHPDGAALHTDILPDITAKGDRFLLARLFQNLVTNAYQYTPAEGTIHVSLKESATDVIFAVRDTGMGIKEEDLPKIWERFYQTDTARTNQNGSMGLGLSMVSFIADCHKGKVTVDSVPGEGSTFTFTFPKNH